MDKAKLNKIYIYDQREKKNRKWVLENTQLYIEVRVKGRHQRDASQISGVKYNNTSPAFLEIAALFYKQQMKTSSIIYIESSTMGYFVISPARH